MIYLPTVKNISNPNKPSIKTVVQVDNSPEPDNTIICVTKDQIFYADVSHNGRVFGRRLTLGETPRKLLLYKPLGVLVVACTKAGLINASGTEQRQQFCTLKIIDPKTLVIALILSI
jgi:hypothetical protein